MLAATREERAYVWGVSSAFQCCLYSAAPGEPLAWRDG